MGCSNSDPFHFIEGDLVAGAVVSSACCEPGCCSDAESVKSAIKEQYAKADERK